MAEPNLTRNSRPIKGDDRDWKDQKDTQIEEMQDAIKQLRAMLQTGNRR